MCQGVYPGVTTAELDELAAETAAAMTSKHPDYAQLAATIAAFKLAQDDGQIFFDDDEEDVRTHEPQKRQVVPVARR